jgi:hypothetical protein
MKRWVVDLGFGRVWPAADQERRHMPEYVSDVSRDVAFVLAVDELGAFVRAKQMLAEAKP